MNVPLADRVRPAALETLSDKSRRYALVQNGKGRIIAEKRLKNGKNAVYGHFLSHKNQ